MIETVLPHYLTLTCGVFLGFLVASLLHNVR